MTRPSKARVRQSFERAAASYDSAANIQRRCCLRLAEGLKIATPVGRLLDAGCGTGFAQPLLQARFPEAHAVTLDLSVGMLQRITAGCYRIAGDLEHLPLADASVDLYWSSLAVQWCELPRALREARRVLRPQGRLAIASLGPATFHELRDAFAGVDDHRHTLAFHSPAEVAQMAAAAGWQGIDVQTSIETAFYPDFKTLLRAVKAIGANQVGEGQRTSLMSRGTFIRAEAAFEALRTPAGLPLTYDVIYLYAQA